MGKTKKFIDKKKSATFQLLARDSSDSDRIFVRVDNNPISLDSFNGSDEPYGGDDDHNSIFDDAPEDYDDDENDDRVLGKSMLGRSAREIKAPFGTLQSELLEYALRLNQFCIAGNLWVLVCCYSWENKVIVANLQWSRITMRVLVRNTCHC